MRKSVSQPYWVTDFTILITDVGAIIEIDSMGRELTRLSVPDSLSGELVSSSLLLPKAVERQSGRVAYWSTRAHAIVIASLRTGTFRVLERAEHEQSPVSWSEDGALYYIDRQEVSKRLVLRLMKRVLSANTATIFTTLATGCRVPVMGAQFDLRYS